MDSLPLQSDAGVVHNCSPTNEVLNSGVKLTNYCHWGLTEGFIIIGFGKRESFTSGSDNMIVYYWSLTIGSFTSGIQQNDSLLLGSDTGIYHWDLTKVLLIIGVRQRDS